MAVAGVGSQPRSIVHDSHPKHCHERGRVPVYGETMTAFDTAAFFDHYQAALLDRDAARIATMYAVPGLILFPGSSIAVTDPAQTEQFFASSFGQYAGVTEVDHNLTVMTETDHSVWADVTWSYDGRPRERFCYQLIGATDRPQIAVLTPLDLP